MQYNILNTTHITQNNMQHSRRPSIRQITKDQEHILCTIKTQKRVEPEVDESVLKKPLDTLNHCFSTFVRPRPGKFFSHINIVENVFVKNKSK